MSRKSKPHKPTGGVGRFSYDGLDRAMHGKARLGILSSLAANDAGLLFNDLKRLCSLTDGNLNRHLVVSSEAGLVETWKGQQGPRPQTLYRLSANDRRQFAEYIDVLERIVANVQSEEQSATNKQSSSGGWSPASDGKQEKLEHVWHSHEAHEATWE